MAYIASARMNSSDRITNKSSTPCDMDAPLNDSPNNAITTINLSHLMGSDFMDSYFGKNTFPFSITKYGNNYYTTYERFRSIMFSVNISLSFLLTSYLSNIYLSIVVVYLILLMDAFMSFMCSFRQHYIHVHSFWNAVKQTIREFQWVRFFNGTVLKAIVFPILLFIFYILSELFHEELVYKVMLILLISSETKSLDKHLYLLFGISVYEKLTSALLKGPLSFMNVNVKNVDKGTTSETDANNDNGNKTNDTNETNNTSK